MTPEKGAKSIETVKKRVPKFKGTRIAMNVGWQYDWELKVERGGR